MCKVYSLTKNFDFWDRNCEENNNGCEEDKLIVIGHCSPLYFVFHNNIVYSFKENPFW